VRYLFRSVLGTFLLAGGITALVYGIAQAIEIGNCGTDEHGRVIGPPCPTGTGAMIALMVAGAFVGIFGAGLYANRGEPDGSRSTGFGMGIAIGQLRFWGAMLIAGPAAAAIGIIDLHEDEFRPGMEVVLAGGGSLVLINILGALMFGGRGSPGEPRRKKVPPPTAAAPSPPPVGPLSPPPVPAEPVRQWEPDAGLAGLGTSTVADSGLAGAEQTAHADVYARLDKLSELHRSGALSDSEYETAKARLMAGL
jgi:Short C-terminal domain